MGDVVIWLFLIVVLAALVIGGAWYMRTQGTSSVPSILFRPKPEKRLAFVEQMAVDNRRKMVLVRRDGVEHLIMIGGPVDVVIETGIAASQAARPPAEVRSPTEARDIAAPVFSRPPRSVGQAASE